MKALFILFLPSLLSAAETVEYAILINETNRMRVRATATENQKSGVAEYELDARDGSEFATRLQQEIPGYDNGINLGRLARRRLILEQFVKDKAKFEAVQDLKAKAGIADAGR